MFINVFPLAVPLSAQVGDGSMDYFITSLSLTSQLYVGPTGLPLQNFRDEDNPNNFADVSRLGDFHGDGFPEFLIGTPSATPINIFRFGVVGLWGFNTYLSATGIGPVVFAVPIPLTRDTLMMESYMGIYPFIGYVNL